VESVELRAAFIVRVQIQTANNIGFHIKSNTAIFHYILRPVYTCNFCPSSATSLRQAANISIVMAKFIATRCMRFFKSYDCATSQRQALSPSIKALSKPSNINL
jgi:hypothetical protein